MSLLNTSIRSIAKHFKVSFRHNAVPNSLASQCMKAEVDKTWEQNSFKASLLSAGTNSEKSKLKYNKLSA